MVKATWINSFITLLMVTLSDLPFGGHFRIVCQSYWLRYNI